MKKNISIFGHASVLFAAAGLLAACNVDDAAQIDLVELGATQKVYTVSEEAGILEVNVLSNGAYHVEQLDDADWISFDRTSGKGDGTLNVSYTMNEEFKRMTRFVLCSDVDSRRDTLSLKQQGTISALLTKENTSLIAPGKGGDLVETIRTNVPFSYMTVKTSFPEGADSTWISGIKIADSGDASDNRVLTITTTPNPDASNPRTAAIDFSFTDGWGDRVGITLNLVQRNSKEGLGRVVSFKEFMDNYATGKPIDEYIILEGTVVSNTEQGNAGENEQTTTSAIDYTGSQKTVYLQNDDASLGIMLLTATPADNVFGQFDKVQVLMYGTTANLYSDPDRVNVKGVTSSMVVSKTAGSKSDIPVKEKSINELNDNDLYTYVTLKDVELPVRKGAISPVNEGYSIGTGANRLSKYPLMVRDRNADHLYMYTNTVCLYRNDGTRLPYGSGKISGVIVHERFSRFEWRDGADPLEVEDDVTLGNIGRYQIRHQTKDDVWGQMKDSVEDSFSALLTEYRFWNPDLENEVCLPTYGTNGWFTHTYQRKYTGSEAKEYMRRLTSSICGAPAPMSIWVRSATPRPGCSATTGATTTASASCLTRPRSIGTRRSPD